MFALEKFYPHGFDPQRYWEDKYAREHIAGQSSEAFAKQGFWPVMQRYLKKGERYLDAGCGIGGWIIFLSEQGYTVEGIDTAARTVRALTEYDRDLKVKVASVTRIPYEDNAFDGLVAIGTLEYVENAVPAALQEIHRVLKPGGFVFMEVPLANTLRRLLYIPLKKLEKKIKVRQGETPTFSNYLFDKTELSGLLEQAGFTVAEQHPHELPDLGSHYGLYIDFRFLRGTEPYKLNILGRLVKTISNAISPWIASTGMVVVATKQSNRHQQ